MKIFYNILAIGVFAFFSSCHTAEKKNGMARIGFLDLLTDETLGQAKKGFFTALKDSGYTAGKNLDILYRNAQGDQPTLVQACSYLVSENVDLIAACPTLSTITAVQQTRTIPVFMLVSPRPDLAGLTGPGGKAPSNLSGVYETLEYIDTSVLLIRTILPSAKKLGTIYNQAEPQSVAALERIRSRCKETGLELVALPVNNSNETQLVTAAVLAKHVDAFFALPDNVVFASMEVIVKSCNDAMVPVFTSEEGLVRRGAVAAFGADMYQWGYLCGMQAAGYLSDHRLPPPEQVRVRRRVYNPAQAAAFHLSFGAGYVPVDVQTTP